MYYAYGYSSYNLVTIVNEINAKDTQVHVRNNDILKNTSLVCLNIAGNNSRRILSPFNSEKKIIKHIQMRANLKCM